MMESALYLLYTHTWQVTILIILALLAERLAGKRFPHLMAGIWLAIVIKCVVPPIFSSPTGIFSWARVSISADMLNSNRTILGTPDQWSAIATVILAIWIGGALFVLLSWMYRWRLFADSLQTCETRHDLQERADQIGSELQLKARPKMLVSHDEIGPLATGIFNPIVVLPNRLVQTSDLSHLDPIIAHELIHIRRRDSLFGLFQMFATLVFWFHPFVRWAMQHMDLNIERCVDSEVINDLGYDVDAYANGLVRILRLNCGMPTIQGLARMSPKQIGKDRIKHVLTSAHSRSWLGARLFFLMVILFCVPGQALQVHPWQLDKRLPFTACDPIQAEDTDHSLPN